MDRSFFVGLVRHSSIEVATGAVVMSMVVASTTGAEVPGVVFWALFLAVWFIYILDRLFDARKISTAAVNPRHHFYQEHHAKMLRLLLFVGLAGLSLLMFLPVPVLIYGVVLMGSCLLYLLWVFFSSRSLPKEVVIAVLYTAGISLAPLAMLERSMEAMDMLLMGEILLIAFINLVLFSRHEMNYDIRDGQESFITRWSPRRLDAMMTLLYGLALSGLTFMYLLDLSASTSALQVVLLLMLAVLWILHRRMKEFRHSLTFRLIGDGIFLIPLFLLL